MSSDWQGHVLVQRSADDDAATLLGSDEWESGFDGLAVDGAVWEALEENEFWDAVNDACGVLVDRYEEEWVDPAELPHLLEVTERYSTQNVSPTASEFTDALAELVRTARDRQVPVIFAF